MKENTLTTEGHQQICEILLDSKKSFKSYWNNFWPCMHWKLSLWDMSFVFLTHPWAVDNCVWFIKINITGIRLWPRHEFWLCSVTNPRVLDINWVKYHCNAYYQWKVITSTWILTMCKITLTLELCPGFKVMAHPWVMNSTVDGLIFVGYQFSWVSWRVQSKNSSTRELVIFCMNCEGKYLGHDFWTPRICHFCSIHENW